MVPTLGDDIDVDGIIDVVMTNPELALPGLALFIGKMVKNSFVNDKYIPIIIIILTGVLGFFMLNYDVRSIVKGAVYGLITVGGHTSVKQIDKKVTKNKRKEE